MEKKLKYVLTIPGREIPPVIKNCLEEQPHRSGLFNWIFAMKGAIAPFWSIKDRLEDFDIIQVNMSPKDMSIIPEIRRILGDNSSTKLVINNDYVAECWDGWKLNPFYYDQIQRLGDMVFSTEEHQVSHMINGTFTIPHPTNTKILKHLGTDYGKGKNCVPSCGFIYHWWNPHCLLAAKTLWKVKDKYGLKSRMYGYKENTEDPMATWYSVMFDNVVGLTDFPTFAQQIQGETVIYDPNLFHTYGRNGVELACFKKPVIGSNRVASYNKLFPEWTIDPMDRNDTMNKFDMVLNKENEKQVQEILDRAYEAVEYYNYENSVKRFTEALDIATKRGGTKWYQRNG